MLNQLRTYGIPQIIKEKPQGHNFVTGWTWKHYDFDRFFPTTSPNTDPHRSMVPKISPDTASRLEAIDPFRGFPAISSTSGRFHPAFFKRFVREISSFTPTNFQSSHQHLRAFGYTQQLISAKTTGSNWKDKSSQLNKHLQRQLEVCLVACVCV